MKKNLLLLLLFTLSILGYTAAQKKKPNIILILADDLGYGDVGFNGQKLIKTPNIDRLAKEGMIFSQFYAGTAVCAPSRSALLSGKHTGHTSIRDNLGVKPEGQYPIADSVLTIAEILKNAGYKTGAFGKWGLGPVGSEGDPNRQGFDRFYGYNCQSLAHRYYPSHLWDNHEKVVLKQNGDLEHTVDYAPDLIQQQALDFIGRHKEEPFFLFLPHILPHAELLVPDDSLFQYYKGRFAETPFKGFDYKKGSEKPTGYVSQKYPKATFAAMVARLDLYVGQVMQKLRESGLEENTLVIFTSDNGPHMEGGADPEFFNSAGGFRGIKRDLYEGGIRIPFIAKWPAAVRSGQQNDFIGAFWDMLPTLSEIVGTKAPKDIDGISFANALSGKKPQAQHEYLYWEFHKKGGKQAVRYGKWKGVRLNVLSNRNGPIELYDLSLDPQERHNIASEFPDIARKIAQFMAQAHVESPIFPWD
ncbi:arylsulfatase [Sphingobacterium sp. DR205]|uniref:arylsulfatase n=1 Tax=Sphingobacterium sp. DR205 TaxID=2713573 RepID=UPI0013E4B720|nr:arylsulfatase [Sphingobacterium sp. DR205]QIH34734.1 arylsulfatase [Sphingobacterium sp. DR205]